MSLVSSILVHLQRIYPEWESGLTFEKLAIRGEFGPVYKGKTVDRRLEDLSARVRLGKPVEPKIERSKVDGYVKYRWIPLTEKDKDLLAAAKEAFSPKEEKKEPQLPFKPYKVYDKVWKQ